MHTIGVATYSVRIRQKRSAEYEPLGAIDGRHSLADLFESYLHTLDGPAIVDEVTQVLLQSSRAERDEDTFFGLMNSGDYGFSADGVNIRSRRRTYRRTPDDAEVIPFYYRAFLPGVSDMGLLLLERYGHFAIFSALAKGFRAFLDGPLPNYILDINRLVPASVIRALTDGELRAIQIVAHTLPDDITDKFRFLGNKQEVGTFIIETRAKKDGILTAPAWLRRIRAGRTHLVELPTELRGSDAAIRVRVDYQGTTRTIDLSDPSNIAPYINATQDVQIEPNGHPSFESIDSYCRKLLDELLQQLGRG